jgi:GxxExxY protein
VTENEIGNVIITSAMVVHSAPGPGVLESAYELCLAHELEKRAMAVRKQVSIPIRYNNLVIENGYRIDLLVNDRVVVELKSIEMVLPVLAAKC